MRLESFVVKYEKYGTLFIHRCKNFHLQSAWAEIYQALLLQFALLPLCLFEKVPIKDKENIVLWLGILTTETKSLHIFILEIGDMYM